MPKDKNQLLKKWNISNYLYVAQFFSAILGDYFKKQNILVWHKIVLS